MSLLFEWDSAKARSNSLKHGVLMNENSMKPTKSSKTQIDYDFSRGVRGKYAVRYAAGSNVVVLAPDIAAHFPTSAAVNRQLRSNLLLRRQGKKRQLEKA
jgi:hypothetical protein